MSESPYIVEVTKENFESVIVHGSMQTPILVDFWAEWCAPCKTLMPILAKLADEYQGAFILAKIDTEAEQEIAAQLGIQSLPTVKLISQGAVVDEFAGALPESEVRAFLDKHLQAAPPAPEPAANPVDVARQLHESGDSEQALAILRAAQAENPTDGDITIALGQVCVATGQYDDARQCLSILSDEDAKKTEAGKLRGMLSLSDADDSSTDATALMAALSQDKTNSEAAYKLGIKQALQGDTDTAITTLLELMQRDREYGEDGARKTLLSIFESMGDDPAVGTYRRKMFNYLH